MFIMQINVEDMQCVVLTLFLMMVLALSVYILRGTEVVWKRPVSESKHSHSHLLMAVEKSIVNVSTR